MKSTPRHENEIYNWIEVCGIKHNVNRDKVQVSFKRLPITSIFAPGIYKSALNATILIEAHLMYSNI